MYQSRKFVCDDETKMSQAVQLFLNKTKRSRNFGNFRVTSNGIHWNGQVGEATIAIRIQKEGKPDLILGNASILPSVGAYASYGKTHKNRHQTVIQKVLEKQIPMLPFSIFQQASLDVNTIEMLDNTGGETIIRNETLIDNHSGNTEIVPVEVHFMGASLFKCQELYFLFDADRRELEHKIFNPFVAKLPKPCKTVKEAYASLMPTEVKKAMLKGLKVLRQGEWFFIPSIRKDLPKQSKEQAIAASVVDSRWNRRIELNDQKLDLIAQLKGQKYADKIKKLALDESMPLPFELRAGDNRPNTASSGITVGKESFVQGMVTHSGREHAPINLGTTWHKAVPNTAIESFQITGDID